MTDVKTAYPNQYYASYDTTATQPTPVTGWYDTWNMSSVANIPAAADMITLTADQWAARLPMGQGVQNGTIVAYTAPVAAIPLATQAQNALTAAASATWQAYGMYGATVPSDVVTYLNALKAIANDTDTTSTTLPAVPADLTSATS